MKIKILLFISILSSFAYGGVVVIQDDLVVTSALSAIAKDMNLKLVNDLDGKTKNLQINQLLSGDSESLLRKLSQVYDFDWYIYGGNLTVESGSSFINYTYNPKNISGNQLLKEASNVFTIDDQIKLNYIKNSNSIFISGTRKFVNEFVSYLSMVDRNKFLESGNNIDISQIKFNYISVNDRSIETFDGVVMFPGAATLISNVIENIGQFNNLDDPDLFDQSFRVKLSQADKQELEDNARTTKVQVLPSFNALLIRGTPEEILLAKRLAKLIDVKSQQLLFTLKVYDVSNEINNDFGLDSSWLSGTRGFYDIIMPPFTQTVDFFKNFQALSSNGFINGVYETNILVLENQQGNFGKKETATFTAISEQQIETQKIVADKSLYITGRLLPLGFVHAHIKYIEESLDDTTNNNVQPPKVNSQSLVTEVYIKPEQTIILGGFDTTVTSKSVNRVPVISSIPLIGELFKRTSEKKQKFKRYISVSYQVVE